MSSSKHVPCSICGKSFKNNESLHMHNIRTHKENSQMSVSEKQHSASTVMEITNINSMPSLLTCSACSKSFSNNRALHMHGIKVHKVSLQMCVTEKQHATTAATDIATCQETYSLLPLEVPFTDAFGQQYQRVTIAGDGLCGFRSLAYCLTGSAEDYEYIIEDCINVFTNCPELFFQRTNFAANHGPAATIAAYNVCMREAIRQIQSGQATVYGIDAECWCEDAHLTAVSLLYKIAIFVYNTSSKKWYAINANQPQRYLCLLNSARHFDVLQGFAPTAANVVPPPIPELFEMDSLDIQEINWTDEMVILQRFYPCSYVWQVPTRPQLAKDLNVESSSSPQTTEVLCPSAQISVPVNEKFTDSELPSDIPLKKPRIQCPQCAKSFANLNNHLKCSQKLTNVTCQNSNPTLSSEDDLYVDSTSLAINSFQCTTVDMSSMQTDDNLPISTVRRSKRLSIRNSKPAETSEYQEQGTQKTQCPNCCKLFGNLARHKKCTGKKRHFNTDNIQADENIKLLDIGTERNNTRITTRSARSSLITSQSGKQAVLTDNTTTKTAEHILHSGTTRKDRVKQNVGSKRDELKHEISLAQAANVEGSHDPLFDRLKTYHDELRATISNRSTERTSQEILDVIANPSLLDDNKRPYQWSKAEEERLNNLNTQCKQLKVDPHWTWAARDDTPQGVANNKRMQYCIEKELEVKLGECQNCQSTVILIGEDQTDGSVCYDCLTLQRCKQTDTQLKMDAWEKVRPQSKNYPKRTEVGHTHEDLMTLNAAERCVIAPVQPVVTVRQNFYHERKLRQECISLIQDVAPVWNKLLPRTTLKDRFIVLERRNKQGGQKYMVARPDCVRQWLRYLFKNHKDFISMQTDNQLVLSEEAIKELELQDELADVTFDTEGNSTNDTDATTANSSEPDDAFRRPELESEFSESHVFSFDNYPHLYTKTKEIIRLQKHGKIELVKDDTPRKLLQTCASHIIIHMGNQHQQISDALNLHVTC